MKTLKEGRRERGKKYTECVTFCVLSGFGLWLYLPLIISSIHTKIGIWRARYHCSRPFAKLHWDWFWMGKSCGFGSWKELPPNSFCSLAMIALHKMEKGPTLVFAWGLQITKTAPVGKSGEEPNGHSELQRSCVEMGETSRWSLQLQPKVLSHECTKLIIANYLTPC